MKELLNYFEWSCQNVAVSAWYTQVEPPSLCPSSDAHPRDKQKKEGFFGWWRSPYRGTSRPCLNPGTSMKISCSKNLKMQSQPKLELEASDVFVINVNKKQSAKKKMKESKKKKEDEKIASFIRYRKYNRVPNLSQQVYSIIIKLLEFFHYLKLIMHNYYHEYYYRYS